MSGVAVVVSQCSVNPRYVRTPVYLSHSDIQRDVRRKYKVLDPDAQHARGARFSSKKWKEQRQEGARAGEGTLKPTPTLQYKHGSTKARKQLLLAKGWIGMFLFEQKPKTEKPKTM